jgi:UDP-N-acetylmuramyl pentapeptide phosphotransferase/UDP-N-acetylglucosamine-1-phosphate transferase
VTRTALLAGAVAGAVSAASLRLLRTAPPGGAAHWDRTNHAGRTVTLLEGPAYVAGSAAGAAAGTAAGALSGVLTAGPAGVVAPVLATVSAGGLGALDDLAGDSRSKGLKGHLGALARGEVTTGAVKVAGLGVTGLVTAALVDGRARRAGAHVSGQPTRLDTLVGGAVVAGAANLLNLLDLRPGRALKVTVLAGTLLATDARSEAAAGSAVGAAAALLGPDLAGETMLGDTGANSAGALLGTALVQRSGRRGRLVALAVLAGLTLASERVSFTRVIESTPGLRELDALGRR